MFGYCFTNDFLPIFKSRTVYLQNTHSFRPLGVAGSYCPWAYTDGFKTRLENYRFHYFRKRTTGPPFLQGYGLPPKPPDGASLKKGYTSDHTKNTSQLIFVTYSEPSLTHEPAYATIHQHSSSKLPTFYIEQIL